MKKIALAIVFAALCFVSNAQPGSPKDLYLTKSLKDASFNKINAETSHGNIHVSATSASDSRVEVYVRANYNGRNLSKEEIQNKLDEYYSIDISVSGDLLTAIAHHKKDIPNGQTSLSISFAIYTAKNTATHLRTSHGDVELLGLAGSQDVSTSHGNIHLEDITGKLTGQTSHGDISIEGSKDGIDLRTDHGNIDATDCEGTTKLITSNGDIQLKKQKGKITAGTSHGNVSGNNIQGDLTATTSHGDVTLRDLSCSVETSTDHGNIDLSVTNITGDIISSNSSGDISLKLPKGKGLDIDFRAKAVNIDAVENFSGSKEKDSMKGTLNGGGTKVKAKTDHGNVSLVFGQ